VNAPSEYSGRDETLALGLYSGLEVGTAPQPPILVARFDYTIRRCALLDKIAATFGISLTKPLPQEHRNLLEKGEEQSPSDKALVERMSDVQREALAS